MIYYKTANHVFFSLFLLHGKKADVLLEFWRTSGESSQNRKQEFH